MVAEFHLQLIPFEFHMNSKEFRIIPLKLYRYSRKISHSNLPRDFSAHVPKVTGQNVTKAESNLPGHWNTRDLETRVAELSVLAEIAGSAC